MMAGRKGRDVLLLFATILYFQTASAQILTPTYFNVAYGKEITATATCGEGIPEPERGERYCKLTGNTGDDIRPAETDIIQGQYCDQCNIYHWDKAHPIEFAIDGTEKWWQSPPISRGLEYNEVNITINLGQLYHVAYIIIKSANSPRPGQWILERSTDFGETYSVWQYFAETASDCYNVFGIPARGDIRSDDDVICTDEYSDIVPLEDGEIVVSLVNGRPGADNFAYSDTLKDWTKATNIRLRLLRTNTLLGHLMAIARKAPTVTRRYFYSIKDISIGGRCFCNGHASSCDTLDSAGRLQCTCEHNTCGAACDTCCPGFVQKRWMPATLESSNECEPCNCFGHSTECYYNEQVAYERRSIDIYGNYEGGGVCQNCQHNTVGINCNHCKDGYYRPEGRDISSPYACERCRCDPYISTGNCADITGECECKPEYTGPGCTQCNEGYYGYPSCRSCDCNIYGTLNKVCHVRGGQCPCKPSYTGRNCDRCAGEYYNFPVCESCGCDSIGSRSTVCDPNTGQCPCHDVYSGRTCSECKNRYFGYPSCRDCHCNPIGTTQEICDRDSGSCLCKENFGQPRCDRCANGYFNYPVCEACNCGPGSTSEYCYDDGQCQCQPNFSGGKCDRCAAGYYRFPECRPCECSLGGASSISCDQYTGQCSCRSNFQGRMCEQCAEGFFKYPACVECNCDPAGVIDVPGQPLGGCGTATGGSCLCKTNVEGRTCNTCQPTYWNLQISNPRGCEQCQCNPDGTIAGIRVCSMVSGQCHCKELVKGRQCGECQDGTYGLEGGNALGCRDCACDVGGAIHGACDKNTGQCICRPRVSGPNCDGPIAIHYYPSLFQYMFEIESGSTPGGGPLRIGYDDFDFPDFSYRGYAIMSNIQPIVDVPITVDRSDIYRIVLRYVYRDSSSMRGKITLIPSGTGSQQSSGIRFNSGYDPQLVTVEGGSIIMPVVLDPGQWTVRIEAPEGVLLDYLVLLPSAYYEAPILQVRVIEPCVAGVSQEMCKYYVFPEIYVFPTVRGVNGYYDNNGISEPIQVYRDRDLLNNLGIPDMALLDFTQPSLYFIIPIQDLTQYIFVVEYYGGGPGQQQATFALWGLAGDVSRGVLNLYDSAYLCRSVVLDTSGKPMVFDVDKTDPTGQIVPIGSPFPLGISRIIAIPIDQWSEDLITPALKCVRTASGYCVPSSSPHPPDSIRVETGEVGVRPEKRLPPQIQDPTTSLMYLCISEGYPSFIVKDVQPLDGNWVFVVHYYQPRTTAVDVNFDIPGEFDGMGTFTGHYCPHVSGCRAVVTKRDGSLTFDLRGFGRGIAFSLAPESEGEIWIDYILAIPESSYTSAILIGEPQDRAAEFIRQCGQQSFYLNPEDVSDFCREAVFSLSVEYNNGAKACGCNLRGSTKLQCNPFGGQCTCRANIIGRTCDRCRIGYYDFPSCKPCTCRSGGVCDEVTGACICPPNVIGTACDRCAPNTYGYNPLVGCVPCECGELGVDNRDLSCDPDTGQCRCDGIIAGRQCNQCTVGYHGFPLCSPCDCDTDGTTPEICDQTSGQCLCKENVEGDRCDQCRAGTFYLNPENDKGCISCFCFGVSSDCKKYNRRRGKITMTSDNDDSLSAADVMSNFGVTNMQEPYIQEASNILNLYVRGTGEDPQVAIYWTLPTKYMGNKLSAYGGKFEYTVQNNPIRGQSSTPIRRPDIIISGNNITVMYTHDTQPQPRQYQQVSIDLVESNFQYSFSARQVMREDFMMVISNIDSFMIRAQYLETLLDSSIGYVSMEVARRDGTGERAYDVERCLCPQQYTGLSCEMCAEGYYRGGPGPYLGTCIPCNCNNHTDRCDPRTGECIDCRDGTTGMHCDQCEDGFVGNATKGTPSDCQPCACPYPEKGRNFATTCVISPAGEVVCFCLAGHVGDRCDRCADGFYGDPSQPGGYCRKCECNLNSDPSSPGTECDPLFGGCLRCRPGTTGDSCQFCADWFWGDAVQRKDCQECNCDQCGSEYCDKNDGSCACKDGVTGPECDRCAQTYWGFDRCIGCTACDCSAASYSMQCDPNTGQCACKPGADGLKCDTCAFGYQNWTPNGCEPVRTHPECNCNQCGSEYCDKNDGSCVCKDGVSGPECDRCAPAYWGFDRCIGCTACNCSAASYSTHCHPNTGQCACKPGADGLKCDTCAIGYWNWTPDGCERCDCEAYMSCDKETGACICPPGASGPLCDQCADRYVLTPNGCEPCDQCVHGLLDIVEDLTDKVEEVMENLTAISTGYWAYVRLNRLNESIQDLQPKLEFMITNNAAVAANMSIVDLAYDDLALLANEVEFKSRKALVAADETSIKAEATKERAEELEGKLNDTWDEIRDAVGALLNRTVASGNLTAEEIARLLEEARRIVAEIGARNFSDNEEMAETELGLAKDVLERAMMLRNASRVMLEQAWNASQNVSQNINDFRDKLYDLLNQSAIANNITDETNAILQRNMPPAFEDVLALVDGNVSAAQGELSNASMILDEAQKLLDDANRALEDSQLDVSLLETTVSELEPHIPILQGEVADMEPLVDMAKEHARNLTKQAEYLDSLLRDTRELAGNAVKAANAYQDITDAINAAEAAAKAALNASRLAEEEADSFGDLPAQSLNKSGDLGKKAVEALNGIGDLEATLGDVNDSVNQAKANLDGVDNALNDVRDGIDNIPEDSSKCTIIVCEKGAPDDCQPGFTGEECDAALLGQQAQEAADIAMDADGSAQRAQDIADWVLANLGDLEGKVAEVPGDVSEADDALGDAYDAINRTHGHINTFRELDKHLTDHHAKLANLSNFMDYNLDELKEKINQARTIAAGVKIAMKFVTDSSLMLRRPTNYQEPSTRNVIELYFNTRMENALLYFAGGPEPTDNYMAIEIKERKPVLRYNLGGQHGEAVVEENVGDGQWHKILAERNADVGKLFVFSEGREAYGAAMLDAGSTLTFSPDAQFFLGGVPASVRLPSSITAYNFEGCIDELVYESEPIGLWNFEEGENVNRGCLRNASALGTPPEEGWYFDGSGYVIMLTPDSSDRATVVSLTFKSFSQDGLLYFMPSDETEDYLALELRGGKLYYHWDLGRGQGEIESTKVYNDGEWTRVNIGRINSAGSMLIFRGSDQTEASLTGSSPAGATGLDSATQTYYGGLTGMSRADFLDVTRQGFRGCIRDILYGSGQITLTKNIGTIGTSPTCVATSITGIAFGGSGGYMSWTPVNIDTNMKLVFQFRTNQPDGLILYTANEAGDNYLAVSLVGGEVHVVADSGVDRIEMRSNNNHYADGELHAMTLNKNVRRLTLTVDETDEVEDQFQKESLRNEDGVLYFGSLPETTNIQAGILPTTAPFIGCIINLAMNGDLLSMISNLKEEHNAITNSCPMANGVTVSPSPEFNVTQPAELTATLPPQPVTTPAPMDKCAFPKDPAAAEVDPADEGAFQFGITPSSRYEYPTFTKEFRRSGTISLDVRTGAFNGLLFYVADSGPIDRAFAFLQDGNVVFGFDYGKGPVLLTSNVPINDGEWHSVKLIRVKKTGTIEIDGVTVADGELRGDSRYLTTSQPFYLGGVPDDYRAKGVADGSSGSLLGCIKNFALNDVIQGPPLAQYDVEPCSGIKEPGLFLGPAGGHVVIAPNYRVGSDLEVRMSLKPRSSTGVIFSVTDTPQGDFLSLEMVDGVLYLRSDNGGGEIEATYTPPEGAYFMCDGNWHDIIAIKKSHTLQLIVDEDEGDIAEGTPRREAADTNHPLFLGGLPVGEVHRGIRTDSTYIGCIRDVMFGEDLIDFKTIGNVEGDVDLQACPTR